MPILAHAIYIMVYFNFAHAVMPMDSLQALEFLNDSWRVRSAQMVELKSWVR
jgi:hypothetical protein